MTQEDKELLLKDLSARLPYGVRYRHIAWDDERGEEYVAAQIYSINTDGYVKNCYDDETVYIDNVCPYLFPLFSMTEEQEKEYNDLNCYELGCFPHTEDALDYLIKNHFDFRCLISKGLAIDATGLNIY